MHEYGFWSKGETATYSHVAGQARGSGQVSIFALYIRSTDHIRKERTYWGTLYFPKMATLVLPVPRVLVELATYPSRDRVQFSSLGTWAMLCDYFE